MDTLPIALRPATPADLPALHALVERAYRGESARGGWTHEADLIEGPRTSADALAAVLADPDECVLLHGDDGRLFACIQVSRRPEGRAYLGMLAVDPTRQAAGTGRRMLAAAEAFARQTFGARTIEMTVIPLRAELVAYYERRGYRLTGEVRPFPVALDPPLSLAVLEKRLET